MPQDLHSLIDQAVQRTKQSAATPPIQTARETAQHQTARETARNRFLSWRAELIRFTEQFEKESSHLLDDVRRLATEAVQITPLPSVVVPENPREYDDQASRNTVGHTTQHSDQQHDRFSALKERLSRQMNTQITTGLAEDPPSPADQQGNQT